MIQLLVAASTLTVTGASSTSTTQWIQAVAAVFGVAAAVGVGFFLYRIGVKQKKIAAMDAFLRIDDRLSSASVMRARSAISDDFLNPSNAAKQPDTDQVSFVLTNFEAIAYATHTKVIDKQTVWSWISDPLLAYYIAFQGVIEEQNRDQPTQWEELIWLAGQLAAINVKRKVAYWPGGYPNLQAVKAILKRESKLAAQLPDSEPANAAGTSTNSHRKAGKRSSLR